MAPVSAVRELPQTGARRAEAWRLALVVAVGTYLLLPGHPLGLLRGAPLDWLGLTALLGLGCLLFGFGLPLAGPLGRRAPLLTLLLVGLIVAKLVLWWVAPVYGLAASYYPRARVGDAPERSTAHRHAPYTRVERAPASPDFGLHFFNDVERFNYYEPSDPDRNALPFAVRWRGYLHVPADATYPLGLAARGVGVLAIDGATVLTVNGRDGEDADELALPLAAGAHAMQLDYVYHPARAGAVPSLRVSADIGGGLEPLAAPRLTVEPVSATALARDRWLALVATALDLVVLGGLLVLGAATVWRLWLGLGRPGLLSSGAGWRHRDAVRLPGTAGVPGTGGMPVDAMGATAAPAVERPLLALLLLGVLVYALLTTADLQGRAVILEGGQDWLTYESYARDILLNGPLMTLGEPLGKGKPFFFQPFYPYYLAGLHWLAGEAVWGPVVLQLFGTGVAGVALYYLARRLYGVRAAVAALALFLVLFLTQLDWIARKLLSENLYFIVLPLGLLYTVRAIDEQRLGDAAWAGFWLGVGSITRAPTLLFVPCAALIVAVAWRRAGCSWRQAAAALLLLGLVTAAVASLVPIRNYIVSGRPALVATNGGATLLLAHQPTEKVRLGGVDRDPLYNALKLDRATREVAEFIRQDPVGYLWTLVPLGLYAVGISGAVEGFPPLAPDVLAITVLYVAALARLRSARTVRALPLHLFVAIHLAIMMTFLPYVYGYRQVLPMQLLMLVFVGAHLAELPLRRWLGRRATPAHQPLLEQRTG